jgi:hypothetical protein
MANVFLEEILRMIYTITNCKSLQVTIKPMEEAGMTARWEPSNKKK